MPKITPLKFIFYFTQLTAKNPSQQYAKNSGANAQNISPEINLEACMRDRICIIATPLAMRNKVNSPLFPNMQCPEYSATKIYATLSITTRLRR